MVVLERPSPDQRVAFVLHDGFGVRSPKSPNRWAPTAEAARQLRHGRGMRWPMCLCRSRTRRMTRGREA